MIVAVFKFLLHAFRCIMQVQLMTMEAIFVTCCDGNASQRYYEKDMPLSTPGLTLEMLIENEESGLVVYVAE